VTQPKLPRDLSGKEVRRALERAGFSLDRQQGSHMVFCRENPYRAVVVPDHKQIRPGTLRAIIRQAGLTLDTFLEML
jgi:predicted RNA binding protein YcfA (HicA-like mRNA interferase family)